MKKLGLDVKITKDITDFANNGQEALKLVENMAEKGESYGLIFMDCSMPIMDGYECTTKIRLCMNHYHLPQPYIVACTGHTEDEYTR